MTLQLPPAPPRPSTRPAVRRSEQNHDTALLARLSNEVPRIPWDRFIERMNWQKGEHVALIGPTGQGKTTLLLNLLPLRPFVVVFATKPRDESLNRLMRKGYQRIPAWRSTDPVDSPRRILWPDATDIDAVATQRAVFRDAISRIYREGKWTIAFDETWYMVNVLNLAHEVRLLLLQGRSLGISLVAATQRPRFVPLEIYDQSTHLFFWRDNDEDNMRRLSAVNVRSADLLRVVIPNLEPFQVVYVNTRTGTMLRTRAPAPVEGR